MGKRSSGKESAVGVLIAKAEALARKGDAAGAAEVLREAAEAEKTVRTAVGREIATVLRLAGKAKVLVGKDIFYDCRSFGDEGQGKAIERLCEIPSEIELAAGRAARLQKGRGEGRAA